MMEKKALLAIVLSVLVWIAWQSFFTPKNKEIVSSRPAVSAPTASSAIQGGGALPSLSTEAGSEEIYEIENDLFRVELSSRGGGIRSFYLKKYRDSLDERGKPINIVPENSLPWFLVDLSKAGVSLPLNATFVRVTSEKEGEFRLQYQQEGLTLLRIYDFSAQKYAFSHRLVVTSERPLQGGAGFFFSLPASPRSEDAKGAFPYVFSSKERDVTVSAGVAEELEQKPLKSIKPSEPWTIRGAAWGGFNSRYFLAAVAPAEPKTTLDPAAEIDPSTNAVILRTWENVSAAKPVELEHVVYLGPKEVDVLKEAGHHFVTSVDYGWFGVFAIPLLFILNFFYDFVGNYGVAIILLTILIKILFWPLSQKSFKSMKEMQRIQPQIAALKEKYKDNKEQLNKEMMNLMKSNNVNPMGGCLPMLFQMPIFFALYRVLYNAIELFHAPFVGWIRDLSAKDPYFVTPLLLGIAMFVQQKMTPSSADPTQAKMMMMMPVVFTALMLYLPAGLVIYILVNTLLTIAHQYFMYKRDPIPEPVTAT